MSKIFLGGTCNNSTWRNQIEKLVQVEMFNPVVDDWTAECQATEMDEKENKCDVHLYVITSQLDTFKEQMKDVYSTSVTTETLDEAPNAYKSISEILETITDTVEIIDIVKPIYNFKAH